MTARARGLAAAIVVAVAAVTGTTIAPSPAAAWSNGACPTASGVTIVVDLTAFGAGVVTRCAPGSPRTGFDVLAGAGFAVEQVQTMAGFVCRIDGHPGIEAEACVTTPPATASWSYWHAARGGTWAYNPVGAAGSRPAPGSVEGWAFVTGASPTPPSIAPPAPPAIQTPPPPKAPAATPAATAHPVPTARATVRPAQPTASAAETSAPATTTPTTDAPSPSPTAPPTGTPSPTVLPTPGPSAEEAAPSSEPAAPIGTALGVGLVAVAAGAALAIQRRRGRHD